MTTIQYGDLHAQSGTFEVQGIGSQPGPSGGDNWQIVASLPADKMPAGARRYVIMAFFRVGNVRRFGSVPAGARGLIQVCLGLDTGLRAPNYRFQIPVGEILPEQEGVPGFFMMIQSVSPSISDPSFGPTFDAGAGTNFCLWARTYWNGDAPTYGVHFDVQDVTWLWWDTTNIPSTDQLCEVYNAPPPLALTPTLAGVYLHLNSPGLAGQRWLHFQSIEYEVDGATPQAPQFQFGYSTTAGTFSGWNAKVGSGDSDGRWGQRRTAVMATPEKPVLHQGCWWHMIRPSGVFVPAVRGRDRGTPATATKVNRVRYFGVRLDNLLDVLVREEQEVANATCNLFSSFPPLFSAYVPMERTASGIIAWPLSMTHAIVRTNGRQAYDAGLMTDTQRILDFPVGFSQSDAAAQEGCSVMGFSQEGLGASTGDIQYRALFIGGPSAPQQSLSVRDVTILQFYPIRDPDVVAPQAPGVGSPVALTPGREAANPASLQAPPRAPERAMPEDPSAESARIDGATGYSRTWPMFASVRRQWTLEWNLNEADATTLYDWLRDNPAFRFTPHREAAVAAWQATPPEMIHMGGGAFRLSVRIVELIWTS